MNEAELKESFTERGSAEGMCRMCLGFSSVQERGAGLHWDRVGKIKKSLCELLLNIKITIMRSGAR